MTVHAADGTASLETDQGIDPERRDLAPLDRMASPAGLGPRLQPRRRKFGPQAERPVRCAAHRSTAAATPFSE